MAHDLLDYKDARLAYKHLDMGMSGNRGCPKPLNLSLILKVSL
jgi:hypothetical protein